MPHFQRVGATLPAKDMQRAKDWYAEKLGLKPSQDSPEGSTYEVGDTQMLLYPSSFAGTNEATAAGFEVDDIESAVAELRRNGVTFEEYDLPDVKTTNGIMEMGDVKGAWFKDSEGNILAVTQRSA